MNAALWMLLMYIGPCLGLVAIIGVPIRIVQAFKGQFMQRYRRLEPWGRAIVGVGAVASVAVLIAAGGAFFSLYSYFTCNAGGGCAQGEFAVAFSFGLFGTAYAVFELLMLPLTISAAKASHA